MGNGQLNAEANLTFNGDTLTVPQYNVTGFATFANGGRVIFEDILEFRGLEAGTSNSFDFYDSNGVVQYNILYNGQRFFIGGGDEVRLDATGVRTVYLTNADIPVAAFAEDTIKFYNASTEVETLRITSAGKVGIGTNNPIRPLSVSNGGAEGFEFGLGDTSGTNLTLHYNRSASAYIGSLNQAVITPGQQVVRRKKCASTVRRVLVGTTSSSAKTTSVFEGNSTSGTGDARMIFELGSNLPPVMVLCWVFFAIQIILMPQQTHQVLIFQ